MKVVKVILNDRRMLIALIHETRDSGNWIVRQWRRSWWGKKRILSEWFIDPDQAMRRAEELKRNYAAAVPRS